MCTNKSTFYTQTINCGMFTHRAACQSLQKVLQINENVFLISKKNTTNTCTFFRIRPLGRSLEKTKFSTDKICIFF